MTGKALFVDLENVQKVDLSRVPLDVRVMVFYGITQKKLPEELVVQAQPLGVRLKWIKISGQGPNALDFHIAFYLGQELATTPTSECVIFSRDTGFDPLVRLLHSFGRLWSAGELPEDAFPALDGSVIEPDHFTRLLSLLRKDKARPAKLKSLAGKAKSWFPRLPDDQRLALVQRLLKESRVRESGKVLMYDFG